MKQRLIPNSVFRGRPDVSDSLKEHGKRIDGKKDIETLNRAERAWMALSNVRDRRQRNINYVYGDQWSDWVRDEHGNWVREHERIAKRTGGVALQNNHLVKIVHSLEGLYAKQSTIPVCFATTPNCDEKSDMMTNALQTNWRNNRVSDLLISWMGEMLLGGVPIAITEWSTIRGVEDVYNFVIEPSHFYFESAGIDPLHRDIVLIGHFEDYAESQLLAKIGHTKIDAKTLRAIYKKETRVEWGTFTDQQTDRLKYADWNNPTEGKYRVYNVWTIEHKLRYRCKDVMDFENPLYRIDIEDLSKVQAENADRIMQAQQAGMPLEEVPLIEYTPIYDTYWHYRMLSPDGTILDEYDNPFEHQDHPYTFKAYEFINGDIIPYISSVIDQQRYINRLVTLFDLMIQASAKGVTLVPKSIVPKNMTEAEFARSCQELGNYIFYDDKGGKTQNKPEIIQSSANMTGITEMLQLQLGFIPEITSVSESLQGKSPGANVAASRYAMETQNSTTSVTGLLEKFGDFERELAKKVMKMIHQYYSVPKNISIKRSNGYSEYAMYDPVSVQDIDFEVNIEMSPKNPVARMAINDLVTQMWQAGAIDAQAMLDAAYIPGSSEFKKQLGAAVQAMQQQAMMAQQAEQGEAAPAQESEPTDEGKRPYVRGDVDPQTANVE